MHVALDGDLPAAIQTPSGVVSAPDPARPHLQPGFGVRIERGPVDVSSPTATRSGPRSSAYDEPFTPSTAPFKRLEAYDAVREDYQLYVRDSRLVPLANGAPPGVDDEAFYADLVVDVGPDRRVRIPSVGPGARIVRARLGVGSDDLSFRVLRDGADNWYLQATGARGGLRARLVMELAIARASFGGQMANPSWSDLDDRAAAARQRRAGCGRGARGRGRQPRAASARGRRAPRAVLPRLRRLGRPAAGRGNVYLDLALSKKGVCRHRAFAFLVTAQSLGIPTRLVLNEAHAWVEIHDGTLWRRIDLGGAGHMTNPASNALPERAVYRPPPDVYSWPQDAERGDDMIADARSRAASSSSGPSGASSTGAPPPAPSAAPSGAPQGATTRSNASEGDRDDRPPSLVTVGVTEGDAHRGLPLALRGDVRAEGEPCAHVAVEVWLRDTKTQKTLLLGTLATGDDGSFAGAIVVPGSTPLGDYDVVARTPGDSRCGSGGSN